MIGVAVVIADDVVVVITDVMYDVDVGIVVVCDVCCCK